MAEVLSTLSVADTSGNTANGGAWYTSMITWEAAARDLVTDLDTAVLECYDDFGPTGLNEEVFMDGWTTSDTFYITIRPAAGSEHNGVVGDGFILRGSGSSVVLDCRQGSTRIEGITVQQDGSGGIALRQNSVGFRTVTKCIAHQTNVSSTSAAFIVAGAGSMTAENNLFIQSSPTSIIVVSTNATGLSTFSNCTLINNATTPTAAASGVAGTNRQNAEFINCVSTGSARNGGIDWGTGFAAGTTNNASGDTTAPGPNAVTGVDSLTTGLDFVDPSTLDFTATIAGKLALTAVDLSAEFLDDITGTLR